MIFVDSNIWCYYLDKRVREHDLVKDPMRQILRSEEIVCNTIVVLEVAHYIVRNFKKKDAQTKIENIVNLRNIEIVDFERQMLTESLETLAAYAYSYGLGGRDSSVVATLKMRGISRIVTHDEVFKRLSNELGITVIDPAEER